ncbi:MAG: hypothetical protein ACYCPT_13955 [Acidimicrobiales bacterium]
MTDRTPDLGKFKGKKIVTTSATIAGLNKRLSETLSIKPRIYDVKETVFAIVKIEKSKDRFDYVRDIDRNILAVEQVQMFDTRSAVFFDEDDKDAMLSDVLQRAVDLFIEADALKKGQLSLLTDDGQSEGDDDDTK